MNILDPVKFPVLSRFRGETVDDARQFFATLSEDDQEAGQHEAEELTAALQTIFTSLESAMLPVIEAAHNILIRTWNRLPEEVQKRLIAESESGQVVV